MSSIRTSRGIFKDKREHEHAILRNEVYLSREVVAILHYFIINDYRIMQNGSKPRERVWRP